MWDRYHPGMPDIASFSAIVPLRDGTQVEIRALRPSDRDALVDAARRTSDQSLYRRFFGVRREFSEREVTGFVDVDFIQHVALVAVMHTGAQELIVAGARYIVVRPAIAEFACTVVDEFQGQGIASALLRQLVQLARAAGVTELIAEVMPENTAMLRVLERSGLRRQMRREGDVVHVTLQLD
jgi:RimJ/RimL family protein N-acetyltransferase